MAFVTLISSHHESELQVLKTKLESAGIPCFLRNEYVTQIMTHMATFDVELQVSSTDLQKAREILKDLK